jgi:hypothetical protein
MNFYLDSLKKGFDKELSMEVMIILSDYSSELTKKPSNDSLNKAKRLLSVYNEEDARQLVLDLIK